MQSDSWSKCEVAKAPPIRCPPLIRGDPFSLHIVVPFVPVSLAVRRQCIINFTRYLHCSFGLVQKRQEPHPSVRAFLFSLRCPKMRLASEAAPAFPLTPPTSTRSATSRTIWNANFSIFNSQLFESSKSNSTRPFVD